MAARCASFLSAGTQTEAIQLQLAEEDSKPGTAELQCSVEGIVTPPLQSCATDV